ncbi:MAG: HPF/RaiA family ribosome-associated protein [Candidatus Loosdrechtia sp.]|uniref:HPF/RaiA family ribosome-associated protein n=1 Tax=Candidatus Loosdrechtia sp. TaxID=3101272 RepID=UPI003A7725F8|nr:MAG: HPF/RaiA family ribosome-associated protein [Candidatus Jettenia sp. AMX2]
MILPLQITARNIELTEAIKTSIREHAEKLDKFYEKLISCRVVVEALPQRSLYNVHVNMTVPGKELVVKREPNADLYIAIRDSFNAARRELEDFSRLQRGDVKHHEEPPYARISTLFPDKGYGFLTTFDGREIYFHQNSVLNRDFKHLEVGMEVRFAEEMGEKGPQASSLTVLKSKSF